MEAHLLTTCTAVSTTCRSRPTRRAPALATRLARSAIALLALAIMIYGARWLLLDAPAAASEFVAATCAVDVVYGDEGPAYVCATANPSNGKEGNL